MQNWPWMMSIPYMHVKESHAGPSLIHGHMHKVQSGSPEGWQKQPLSFSSLHLTPLSHLLTFCAEDPGTNYLCSRKCYTFNKECWAPPTGGHTTAPSGWQMARRPHLDLSRGQAMNSRYKQMTKQRVGRHTCPGLPAQLS